MGVRVSSRIKGGRGATSVGMRLTLGVLQGGKGEIYLFEIVDELFNLGMVDVVLD